MHSFDHVALAQTIGYSPYCVSGRYEESFNLLTFKYVASGFSIGRLYTESISQSVQRGLTDVHFARKRDVSINIIIRAQYLHTQEFLLIPLHWQW